MMRAPMLVLKPNTKRESGRKVQTGNVYAAKTISDVIRTCLGPRAMLKMLMDPMGGIVLTNDGNAILREITVKHPAAKSMIEIARTQDEEVGDGTTSVIVLAGEILAVAEPLLEQQMHPTVIIAGYKKALEDAVRFMKTQISRPVDAKDWQTVSQVVQTCIGTKLIGQWEHLATKIALEAVAIVRTETGGKVEIDLKRYARVEKIPGGLINDSYVLGGIMLNKDVLHPKMRRRIEKPRIILLDCPLEYKKGESQTNVEMSAETDFQRLLEIEEEQVKSMCDDLIAFKPDLVLCEKGVSDLAIHFLAKANVSCLRRLKKTDNNRVARATGATIVSRTDELKEEDVGTKCALFEVRKIGDEYFSFMEKCEDPKACTIVLRGASKEILNEVERNLRDALQVSRNIMLDPRIVPGGGATEMELACLLEQQAKNVAGVQQWAYRAVAQALEVIPRTLIQNSGGNTIRQLTLLRSKHNEGGNVNLGVNGATGELADMAQLGIWEPISVKMNVVKVAVEVATLLLRIDDIVSGSKRQTEDKKTPTPAQVSATADRETDRGIDAAAAGAGDA